VGGSNSYLQGTEEVRYTRFSIDGLSSRLHRVGGSPTLVLVLLHEMVSSIRTYRAVDGNKDFVERFLLTR
jgi:hypothetical protein